MHHLLASNNKNAKNEFCPLFKKKNTDIFGEKNINGHRLCLGFDINICRSAGIINDLNLVNSINICIFLSLKPLCSFFTFYAGYVVLYILNSLLMYFILFECAYFYCSLRLQTLSLSY